MHKLKIPRRAMFIVGPQRCGKTTTLTQAVASISKTASVLVIGKLQTLDTISYGLSKLGALAKHVTLHNIRDPSEVKYDDSTTVVLSTDAIFEEPGVILLSEKPSDSVIEFFETISKEKFPRFIFVEAFLSHHQAMGG